MKHSFLLTLTLAMSSLVSMAQNPFLQRIYGTPYEIPPFEKFTVADYREGILKGMEEEKAEIIDAVLNGDFSEFAG